MPPIKLHKTAPTHTPRIINPSPVLPGQSPTIRIKDSQEFLNKLNDIAAERKVHLQIVDPVMNSRSLIQVSRMEIAHSAFRILILTCLGGFVLYKVFKKPGALGKSLNSLGNEKKDYALTKEVGVRFKDVAGMLRPKEELSEFVQFLKEPERFHRMGAEMPKGALMTGPPGVGKTYLAKAIAGEADVPFFFVSGSEFVEKYVGVGASRVRELFSQARKAAPSLIFIDEIDAVAKSRDSLGGNEEGASTLNQLLIEMDGFESGKNIVVIGSTNMKEVLDPAILRPGRFDRIIEIGLPTLEEREEILEIYLVKIKLLTSEGSGIDFYKKRLATLTPGFTGADLSNIVNEVGL